MKPLKTASNLLRLRKIFTLLFVGYFFIGISSHLFLKKEIFPLFSWFLFSKTPNQITSFTIILYKHNGQILEPPIFFHQAPKTMADSGAIAANSVINQLGRKYRQGNQSQVRNQRKLLEENYLKGEIEYGLIQETYEPIERWKNGKVNQKLLVKFKSGGNK